MSKATQNVAAVPRAFRRESSASLAWSGNRKTSLFLCVVALLAADECLLIQTLLFIFFFILTKRGFSHLADGDKRY